MRQQGAARVHWFNPNAEGDLAALRRGDRPVRNRMTHAMEHDLEAVMLAGSRATDVWVARRVPTPGHVRALVDAGFEVPEIVDDGAWSGPAHFTFRPWARSRDAWTSGGGCPVTQDDCKGAGDPVPDAWLSKEIGIELLQRLEVAERGVVCRSYRQAEDLIGSWIETGPLLVKGGYACAGRSQYRVFHQREADRARWLPRLIEAEGLVVIEPLRDRVLDFSVLYEIEAGRASLLGMSLMDNDARGRYLGSRVAADFERLLGVEVRDWLLRQEFQRFYEAELARVLIDLLPGYSGPVGVDAMVYREQTGAWGWSPVVELNVRNTMGRVALDLMGKSSQSAGSLRILRKSAAADAKLFAPRSMSEAAVLLNDPEQAEEFLVSWHVG